MRRNPFERSYPFMAKNVTITELISHYFKRYEDLDLVKKIIEKYFNLIYEYLLQGKIVYLPLGLGELCIVKKKASELSERKKNTKERYEKSVKKAIKYKKFNYSKIGYFYMIAASGWVYEKGMYLKPPNHIKKKITENIMNNKDYRYEKYGLYNDRSKQSS